MKFRLSFFRLILIVALGVVVGTLFIGLWSSCDYSVSDSVDNHHEDVSEFIGVDTISSSVICFPIPRSFKIDFVDSIMPEDDDVVFCVAAAFTRDSGFDEFCSELVANDYVTKGQFKKGYPCRVSLTGNFCSYTDTAIISKKQSKSLMDSVIMYGGSYFQQNLAVYNGEIEKRMAFSNPDTKFDYRFLCQLTDSSFAVIEIRGQGYLKALQQLCSIEKYRVKNALYLDMGAWSDGYYRSNDGLHDVSTGKSLICVPTNKYQTNWLIVRRVS